jgi:hypothetical protein
MRAVRRTDQPLSGAERWGWAGLALLGLSVVLATIVLVQADEEVSPGPASPGGPADDARTPGPAASSPGASSLEATGRGEARGLTARARRRGDPARTREGRPETLAERSRAEGADPSEAETKAPPAESRAPEAEARAPERPPEAPPIEALPFDPRAAFVPLGPPAESR